MRHNKTVQYPAGPLFRNRTGHAIMIRRLHARWMKGHCNGKQAHVAPLPAIVNTAETNFQSCLRPTNA